MRSKVVLPDRDEARQHRKRIVVVYSNWDEEEDDEEFNPYGRCDVSPYGQAGHLPLDRIVMWVSPQ